MDQSVKIDEQIGYSEADDDRDESCPMFCHTKGIGYWVESCAAREIWCAQAGVGAECGLLRTNDTTLFPSQYI